MKTLVKWPLVLAVVVAGLVFLAPEDANAWRWRCYRPYYYPAPVVRVVAPLPPPPVYVAPPPINVAPPAVRVYSPPYYGPRVVTPWVTIW